MYITSNKYKEKILEPTRKFEANIKIGNDILTNEEVMNFNIEQSIQQDATFSIGNTISTSFNLVFSHNSTITIDDKDLVEAKLGLKIDESIEYIPLGYFNIDNIETNDTTTTILAYDNMVKFEVGYVEDSESPTIHSVINKLQELTKVSFGGDLNKYKNYKLSVLENYSCREVLGFIAGVLGANATINREGKFDFVTISNNPIYGKNGLISIITKDGYILKDKEGLEFEIKTQGGYITADNYLDYTKKNKNYKISKITNSIKTEELTIGNNDNMELLLSNPYITEDILKDLNANINGLEFLPYSVVWSGDIALELGDLVTITDKKGNIKAYPILAQNISYNGALSCTISAQGETTLGNAYKSTSQEENEITRNSKKVVQIQKDAGEVYVVVYDDENNSSVRLTEKSLEAIAEEINLSAKNINLEGYITANGNFSIDEKGNMTANNGTFIGQIKGASNISIGNTSQDGINPAFRAVSSGSLKIGGNSAYIHTDGINKAVAEITSLGTIYSCSTNEPYTYTQITEGKITVSGTIYDDVPYGEKITIGDNSIKISDMLEIYGNRLNSKGGGEVCFDVPIDVNNIKSYDSLYFTCNNSSISNTDGGAIRFFNNSNGDYVFRSITEGSGKGNTYCGTTTYPWKAINAITLNQISDRGAKENIEYLNDYNLPNSKASKNSNVSTNDCYEFIRNDCMLATYNHIDDDKKKINFIANDLLINNDGTDNKIGQLIVDACNGSDEENNILSFDINNYLSVTVGALQQAIKKIERLEEEIETLKIKEGGL